MKKRGTGVSQVLKYPTGLSRSTKRYERRIMPSSPGKSTACCCCARARVRIEGAAPAASAAAENCLRKRRREFMGDTSIVPDLHQANECCRLDNRRLRSLL